MSTCRLKAATDVSEYLLDFLMCVFGSTSETPMFTFQSLCCTVLWCIETLHPTVNAMLRGSLRHITDVGTGPEYSSTCCIYALPQCEIIMSM